MGPVPHDQETRQENVQRMTPEEIDQGLRQQGYIADRATVRILQYACLADKPLLVEGPAGAGKTGLAKAWSRVLNRELIRLQCHEGIDESKALYEWDYQKQLLYVQTLEKGGNNRPVADMGIYTNDFLLPRPLLRAISCPRSPVLLIDEVDKSDEEFESFLLEVLSDWQVSIPEIGTVAAASIPSVILTSNSNRNLSEALRRRCFYLYLDYPDKDREMEILRSHFPALNPTLGEQVVAFVRRLRLEKLRKHPSISEVIDWARVLDSMGVDALTAGTAAETITILLKHREDCELVRARIADENGYDGLPHP
jgi:MoxR-like ATPase